MTDQPNDEQWDELAAVLEAYDEALKNGSTHARQSTSLPHDDDLPEEVILAKSALELLHRVHQEEPAEHDRRSKLHTDPHTTKDIQLGRFQIIRELGRGGFGVVHLAWDQDLQREVALKLPRAERLLSQQDKARFIREGRAAATLAHPNIIPVFAAGADGPFLYLATAYCRGPSLAGWLAQAEQPTDPNDAAQFIAALANALQHAHDRGIVHRDIKPSTILLEGNPEQPKLNQYEPRLTDFGLAKWHDAMAGDRVETRDGAVLGTPAYMSPEQATGNHSQIGPQTDVYGLGAVLYELLTGRPPFQSKSELSILKQVEQSPPQPIQSIRSNVPRNLSAICLKCLEKSPARRYASAAALSQDLRCFLDGAPVQARHATLWERAARWTTRNPLPATAATLVSLALLVVVATIYTAKTKLEKSNRELIAAKQRTDQALKQSNDHLHQSRQALQEMVRLGDFRRAATPEPDRVAALQRAITFYEEMLSHDSVDDKLRGNAARCYLHLAQLHARAARPAATKHAIRRAIDILATQTIPNAALHEKALSMRGMVDQTEQNHLSRLADLRASLQWNTKRRSNDDAAEAKRLVDRTVTVTSLARTTLYYDRNSAADCHQLLDEHETELRQSIAKHPEHLELAAALARVLRAKIYGALALPDSSARWIAPRVLEESRELQERVCTVRGSNLDYSELASLLKDQATLALKHGNIEPARKLQRRRAEVVRHLIVASPHVAIHRVTLVDAAKALATFAKRQHRHADVDQWFAVAIEHARWLYDHSSHTPTDADQLADLLNDAAVRDLRGRRYQNALSKLSEVDSLRTMQLAEQPDSFAVVVDAIRGYCNLVTTHIHLRNHADALLHATRALDLAAPYADTNQLPTPVRRALLTVRIQRSILLAESHQVDESLAEAERAVIASPGQWNVHMIAFQQYCAAIRIAAQTEQTGGKREDAYLDRAREHLRATLRTIPKPIAANALESIPWMILIMPNLGEPEWKIATQLMKQLEAAKNSDTRASRLRLAAAFAKQDWPLVRQEAEPALAIQDARRAIVLWMLAEASRQLGDDAAAAEYVEQAKQAAAIRYPLPLELPERLWIARFAN